MNKRIRKKHNGGWNLGENAPKWWWYGKFSHARTYRDVINVYTCFVAAFHLKNKPNSTAFDRKAKRGKEFIITACDTLVNQGVYVSMDSFVDFLNEYRKQSKDIKALIFKKFCDIINT